MKLLMTGASGLIGRALIENWREKGYQIVALSRYPQKNKRHRAELPGRWLAWPRTEKAWREALDGVEGIVHLAGAPLLGGLWTRRRRRVLYDSRVGTTQKLVQAVQTYKPDISFYIQTSAIGYYACDGADSLVEESPPGDGFLAHLTKDWENAAHPLRELGIPCCFMRLGMVLAPESWVIRLMKTALLMYVGGTVGSGRQIISWVHIRDVAGAFEKVMQ
ncbi:MAG: NAD-dependent epimerase/dehydratase family protein, partial [Calditrichaeota bacterium]